MTIERWERQLNKWMEAETLDDALSRELRVLMARRDRKARRDLEERFYKDLEFGTSGLRGLLGAGTNRLNVHTVRKITQGICDYIAEDLGAFDGVDMFTRTLVTPENLEKAPAVAIAYDSRNNSRLFAECAAEVLVANGIRAYMYDEIVPVAALSYAVRKFGCLAGLMMTASHNPADYNGVKVYNASGCQVMPGEQKKMYRRISALDEFTDVSYLNFDAARKTDYFTAIEDSVIEEYIDAVLAEKVYPAKHSVEAECAESCTARSSEAEAFAALKVVYTPLNGGGMRPAREMMKRLGIEKVEIVKSQEKPDGNFTTCPSPNPELDEAYKEAFDIAKTSRPDVIIATDPDCDRIGVVVKLGNGMYRKLSGDEIGIVILDYIIRARKSHMTQSRKSEEPAGKAKAMPQHPVTVRTITSSTLADIIARKNDVELRIIPNGSNYIGESINRLVDEGRGGDFIFAFEDTNQCISGLYSRDEDGVLAAMHILCAAAYAKAEGKTLQDVLDDIYNKYGYFESDSASIAFSGIEGLKHRDEIMAMLRSGIAENKWNKIGDKAVEKAIDYMAGHDGFPKLNTVEFRLADDAGVIVRPSGTEPKLKIYMHASGISTEDAREKCGAVEHDILSIINA